ncbi:hypothetical protein VTN00DRAFT_3008 [Thermoascus crustaceus]|uniref:uncharacterized protein n=1 Tax=Thermoascus crustaceus TaxID=5088 RepID=UPI0037446A51
MDPPSIDDRHTPSTRTTADGSEAAIANSEVNIPDLSLLQEILILTVTLLAQLFARAGLSQSIAPINYIGATFGTTDPTETLWFPAAFSLTAGTFILVAGGIGDIIGHRELFIGGLGWFAGMAAAVLTPTGLAILGSIYKPGTRKNKVFSIFGAAAPNGFVLGALFASLLAELAWWPWAYWIMAILCALLAAVLLVVLPDLRHPSECQSFDYAGAISALVGLTLFNVALNQAPSAGWSLPYVILLLVLGIASGVLFFFIEQRVRRPLIPVKQMSSESLYVLGCIALGWSSFGIWLFYPWEFLETLRRVSPLEATAQIVPGSITGLAAALMTGFLLGRVRKPYIMIAALLSFCAGNVILATMPVHQSYWLQAFWSVIIMPFGMDLSFPTATVIMSDLVPRSHQAVAASTIAATVNYSISVGLGIAGTVEAYVAAGDVLRGFRGAWYSAIGLSGCGIVLAVIYKFKTRAGAKSKVPPGGMQDVQPV